MGNKSQRIMNAELKIIEDMLFSSSTDQEIMKAVGVSKTTFHRYKARIYKEHSTRFIERKFDNVGFYTEQLHNRLTRYLKLIEKRLESCNDKDAAILAQTSTEIACMIFDLNLQGLEIIDDVRELDNKVQTLYKVSAKELNYTDNDNIEHSEDQQDEDRLLQQNQEAA